VSLSGPFFHAWCDDEDRIDALATAASALFHSSGLFDVVSIDRAVTEVRAAFAADRFVSTSGSAGLRSRSLINFDIEGHRDGSKTWFRGGPLLLSPDERRDLLVERIIIAVSAGSRSVEIEAAILAILGQQDIIELLMCLCAPGGQSGVTTGACSWSSDWGAPVQACATYHADSTSVARDLALSWIHLHDGDKVQHVAGLSMTALRARVETSARGASVAVAGNVDLIRSQIDRGEPRIIPVRLSSVRGAEIDFDGFAELTREAVMQAIDTPPSMLLDALEASAQPDSEWRSVEADALEIIEAVVSGAPTYEVYVNSRKHLQFIQRHAPHRVHRLPNGGVMLATHPYRTLWPLYADALFLLGIMP
jgi:hypothetical protein